jgi:hypothetical protein
MTTRRYNPEDSHLRTHRREDLKSYKEDKDWQKILAKTSSTTELCLLGTNKFPCL